MPEDICYFDGIKGMVEPILNDAVASELCKHIIAITVTRLTELLQIPLMQ